MRGLCQPVSTETEIRGKPEARAPSPGFILARDYLAPLSSLDSPTLTLYLSEPPPSHFLFRVCLVSDEPTRLASEEVVRTQPGSTGAGSIIAGLSGPALQPLGHSSFHGQSPSPSVGSHGRWRHTFMGSKGPHITTRELVHERPPLGRHQPPELTLQNAPSLPSAQRRARTRRRVGELGRLELHDPRSSGQTTLTHPQYQDPRDAQHPPLEGLLVLGLKAPQPGPDGLVRLLDQVGDELLVDASLEVAPKPVIDRPPQALFRPLFTDTRGRPSELSVQAVDPHRVQSTQTAKLATDPKNTSRLRVFAAPR